MGAEQFEVHVEGVSDVQQAFNDAVEQAAWEYGHGGYTGTIAEKGSYVILNLPEGVTAAQAIDDLCRSQGYFTYQNGRSTWVESNPKDYLPENIRQEFNDKWGDAVAIRDDEGTGWWFAGYASS